MILQNLAPILPIKHKRITHQILITRQVQGIQQLVKQLAIREHLVCSSMKHNFQRGMIKINSLIFNRFFELNFSFT